MYVYAHRFLMFFNDTYIVVFCVCTSIISDGSLIVYGFRWKGTCRKCPSVV